MSLLFLVPPIFSQYRTVSSRVIIPSSDCSWMKCVTLKHQTLVRKSRWWVPSVREQVCTVTMETFVFAEEEERRSSDWSRDAAALWMREWGAGAEIRPETEQERRDLSRRGLHWERKSNIHVSPRNTATKKKRHHWNALIFLLRLHVSFFSSFNEHHMWVNK